MKLKLNKKAIKQLSKDNRVLPAKLTRHIAGGALSEKCVESDPVFCGPNQN